jgi:hypothetical protein
METLIVHCHKCQIKSMRMKLREVTGDEVREAPTRFPYLQRVLRTKKLDTWQPSSDQKEDLPRFWTLVEGSQKPETSTTLLVA